MPYVDAILKETMRIHPIVPMALPYKSLEACTYKGESIPTFISSDVFHLTLSVRYRLADPKGTMIHPGGPAVGASI